MKYKQKEEIKTEYFTNASFKKTFLNQMKDWKFVISIVIGGIVWNVYYYSTLILSFNLIDPNNTLNPGELFNYVNVASTANNLVPIPGAEGTIQAMLLLFIQSSAERQDGMNVNPEALKNIINSSVIIWRTFTFYLTTALGAAFFLLFLFKESYKTRQKNRRNKSSLPHKTFSVLIPFSSDFDFMQYSVNSVLSNSYNRERIQIVLVNHGSPLPPSRQEIVNKILGNNCNVDYYQYPTNNLNELLNQALAQNWIKNDYLQILEPRSFLNFAFLEHVDNIAASNDVYFGRFRQVKSNFKKTHIISPYFFLARRKEVDRSKINFEKINPFNTFIKVNLLKKYQKFNMLPTQSLATYLNNIITKAPSVRYLWRLSGNYYPATEKWTNLPVKTYVDNETNNKYISLNS